MADHKTVNRRVTIDLITQLPDGYWAVTLVEQGPWSEGDCNDRLSVLQERLWGCFEAVTLGLLANKYPDSLGAKVVIRLHCYDTPHIPCRSLFDAFAGQASSEFRASNGSSSDQFVEEIKFTFSHKTLNE